MACESRSRQLALVSTATGIPASASQRGFYAALTAGTALGALLLGRWLTRPKKSPSNQSRSVPTLTGQLQLDPIPAGQLNDQQCSGCRSKSQDKRGLWYAIRGSTYCQDCAPAATRQGGFSLTVPSQKTSAPGSFNASRTRPVAVKLKPGRIRVGPTQVEGYTVLRAGDGQETGLTITPAFKIDSSGQMQVNRTAWFVNYDRVGQPIGGPYQSLEQVKGLAAELACLDWTQPVERFSDNQIQEAVQLTRSYRQDTEFREYMARIR